jgi:RNA-directed DNA polymerase
MIKSVLKWKNIDKALRQTIANKGASGVDSMSVTQLRAYMQEPKETLFKSILEHKYVPQAIRGVEIPKSQGKTRLLGVPTVIDRALQQAVNQILTPYFEPDFHRNSYGFRPHRNAQQAVLRALGNINDGFKYIVDIDLANFFDEIDHCILLELIYKKVKCPTTLRLIRKWLRAPMLINGKLCKRRKGVPQGSPLSPLLSNIVLNELDTFLESKRQKFVRYADDFSIYCKGRKRAEEIGNQVYLFLKKKLKLSMNRAKSGIRRPTDFTILGYNFTSAFEKNVKGKYQLIVSEKSWKKLKGEIKVITRKTSELSFTERVSKLKLLQRGWLNYFRLGNIQSKLESIDGWIRNRLRLCIWKDWKKAEKRRRSLIRLGVSYSKAYAFSRTRKGTWAIAQSPIMTTTVTLERLAKRGYESMTKYFYKLNPKFNEPLYT